MNQKEVIQNIKVEEFKKKSLQNTQLEKETLIKFIDRVTTDIVILDYSIEDLLVDLCDMREGLEAEVEVIKKSLPKQE